MFFKNYRTIIFVGAVFAAAILLLSYNLKYDSGGGLAKKIVLEAATPFQKFLSAAIGSVNEAWMRYIRLVGLEDENRRLKNKVAGLQAQLLLYQESYQESQRLQKLFALAKDAPQHYVAANVIGREQAALSKTVWIDKGSAHGLKPGMPVVASPGLIGRLTDVTWHSAKVLLLIDESSNVDVFIQRTRVQGIVRGAGARGCVVKYISKIQDVKEGDLVLSAGMSNVFPKGLLIGKVSSVDRMDVGLFLQIHVSPFVDFSKIEEVLVLASGESARPEGENKTK